MNLARDLVSSQNAKCCIFYVNFHSCIGDDANDDDDDCGTVRKLFILENVFDAKKKSSMN